MNYYRERDSVVMHADQPLASIILSVVYGTSTLYLSGVFKLLCE